MKKRRLTCATLFILLTSLLVAAELPIPNRTSGSEPPKSDSQDWRTYKDRELGVEIRLPFEWKSESGEPARFKGSDGGILITASSAYAPEDVCRGEAIHKLRPYGTHPRIERLKVTGIDACVVWPSSDQIPSASAKPEAMLVVQYPSPIRIDNSFYWQLSMYGDVEHILAIAETVRFSSEVRITPPDTSRFVPKAGSDDDLNLDLDEDGIPEVAIRYTTDGIQGHRMETLKLLRYTATSGWAEAFQENIDGVQPNFLNIWQVVTCADGKQGLLNTISMKGTQNVSTWYVLASVNGEIIKLEPPRERLDRLKANGYDGRLAQVVVSKGDLLLEEFVRVKNPRLNTQPPDLVLKYRFTGSAIEFVSLERHQ